MTDKECGDSPLEIGRQIHEKIEDRYEPRYINLTPKQFNTLISEHKLIIKKEKYGVVGYEFIDAKNPPIKRIKCKTMLPEELAKKLNKKVDVYLKKNRENFEYNKKDLKKLYDQVFKILFREIKEEVIKKIQKEIMLLCDLMIVPEDSKEWENMKTLKLCPTFELNLGDKIQRFLF